jgi:hypothetical protein
MSSLVQVDGDGDGLQPLPQMTRPTMQRSFSSHALGQLRHMPGSAAPPENGMNSRPSQMDRSGGLTSPGARLQPNLAEFQTMGMRPMMRRVYSAGDIQVLEYSLSPLRTNDSWFLNDKLNRSYCRT